jgi:iron complex outermembrane receptor protein
MWLEWIAGLAPNREYYRNNTVKDDVNAFAKVSWEVARGLSLWGDVQYRHIGHTIGGVSDLYDMRAEVRDMVSLDVGRTFDFFNPKAGIYWDVDPHNALYASAAVAHKEPVRNNYLEAREGFSPRSERLVDAELGYKLRYERVAAEINLYYMDYKDQLVRTGEINELGQAVSANVPRSFRTGAELSLGWQPVKWFRWDVFGTFSVNRILDYTDYLYDQAGVHEVVRDYRGTVDIAFSPSVIAGNIFSFNVGGFYGAVQTNYVSKQYLTNSRREELSLPGYCVTGVRASYRFALRGMKYLEAGVAVGNLFNAHYSASGWGASSVSWEGNTPVRHDYAGYYPQATINASGTVTMSF